MNATVTIGTRGATSHDDVTDDTTTTWSQVYAGPARIQALTQAERQDVAGQQITGRPYLVQLDARIAGEAALEPGMRIRCLTSVNDTALAGQDLWLVDFQFGSERFTRDVVASDNQSDAPAVP